VTVRVKVRAVIWMEGKLVVYRSKRRGLERTTLPGGRVNAYESVTDALVREVLEEIGITIEVGELLCVAEVLNSTSIQDVELVFAARALEPIDDDWLELVDPLAPEAEAVLPPIVARLVRGRFTERPSPEAALWLGNVYRAEVTQG
jgi:8-oxo-dGTP diphosphatase